MLALDTGNKLETEDEILALIERKKQFQSRNGNESPFKESKSGKDRSDTQTNNSLYLPHIKQFIPRATIFNKQSNQFQSKQSPGRHSPSPENPLDPDFGTYIDGVRPFPSLPMHRGSPLGHHRNEDTNQGS